MANTDRIAYLLKQADARALTEEECLEVELLLTAAPSEYKEKEQADDEEVLQILNDHYQHVNGTDPVDVDQPVWQQMLNNILNAEKPSLQRSTRVHRMHFLKTAWVRYVAAVIVLVTGAFFWSIQRRQKMSDPSATVIASTDILPGSQKATLTLSSGQRITLDPRAPQQFTDQSQVIRNLGGRVSYEGSKLAVSNTMTTPPGGQYQLILPDQSRVWLNAASSVTYPTAFNGQTREVSITGEAYFEVARDKEKPFIVLASSGARGSASREERNTGVQKIVVLGTSFNVNAYSDEPSIKTSLVNGAVRVDDELIHPGEAYTNGTTLKTNIGQDIAWKNGYFNFNNQSFKAVMRQLERWYDITVKYQGDFPDIKFEGKLSRDLTLSQILEILKEMDVNYKIEGRNLFVSQNQ